MRALTLTFTFLTLAACDTSIGEPGRATACLAGTLPENLYEYEGDNLLFEVEGTVLSDEAGPMPETAMECYFTISRVLRLEDAEGTIWSLGYAGTGDPLLPAALSAHATHRPVWWITATTGRLLSLATEVPGVRFHNLPGGSLVPQVLSLQEEARRQKEAAAGHQRPLAKTVGERSGHEDRNENRAEHRRGDEAPSGQ